MSLLCYLLYWSGINWLYDVLMGPRLLLIGYHSIADNDDEEFDRKHYRQLSISKSQLESQIHYLKKKRYTFYDFRQLRKNIYDGTLANRAVILYFDDGYRDIIKNGLPILRTADVPGTVFPTVNFIDRVSVGWGLHIDPKSLNIYLSWVELTELAQDWEIGTHAMTHRRLSKLTDQEVRREIHESTDIIEEHIQHRPIALSCPHSAWSDRVAELAVQEGISFVFAKGQGPNYAPYGPALKKIPIGPKDDKVTFAVKLGVYYALLDMLRWIKHSVFRYA